VRSGFPSGIAQAKTEFQEKCAAVFRPELRKQKPNSRRSARRFSMKTVQKGHREMKNPAPDAARDFFKRSV